MTCSLRGNQGAYGHLWPGYPGVRGPGSTSCPCPQRLVMPPGPVSPPPLTPQQGERGTGGSLPGTGQSPGTDSDTTEATLMPAVPANQVPAL